MPPTIERFLASAWSAVRIADAVDVLLITVFFYSLITWLRGRFRLLVGGLALLAAVYAAAKVFEMHLTLILLRAFAAVAVVGLLVVFHKELRRGLEHVALALRGKSETAGPAESIVEVLATSLSELSRQQVGALIVLPGREPLGRHLSHAVLLDAKLSDALLYSLFDPNSPGHDGAIIVSGDRVTHFSVHLPLADGGAGRRLLGTRHAAAVGLSEQCDALVLVVSEERGTMSVATAGKLKELDDVDALRAEVRGFLDKLGRTTSEHWFAGSRWERVKLATLSLTISLVLWAAHLSYRGNTAARTLVAPIIVENVPEGWRLDAARPSHVSVSLSGPVGAIDELDATDVSVAVDASTITLANGYKSVTISSSDVSVGEGFTVLGLDPKTVRLRATQIFEVTLPVEADIRGALPSGRAVTSVGVKPSEVHGVVDALHRDDLRSIKTRVIDLGRLQQTESLRRQLILPQGFELAEETPNVVTITVDVAPPASLPEQSAEEGPAKPWPTAGPSASEAYPVPQL